MKHYLSGVVKRVDNVKMFSVQLRLWNAFLWTVKTKGEKDYAVTLRKETPGLIAFRILDTV
jgi:hypothetical protein